MAKIWEPENKFQKWLDVELAACKAHAELGNIPQEDYDTIIKKSKFEVSRIDEIEKEINHDVIAFLTNVAEHVGDSSRFIHLGLTSSDVVDTAFAMLIQESGKQLEKRLEVFMDTLKTQAARYKNTPMMGRTHGVHAEPMTFGLKLTVWYEEMKRNQKRLADAMENMRVGKVSGAVGNYAHMPPNIEEMVCKELNLNVSPASTQILQRDRHAHVMTTICIISGTLEKIATEIRSLQKTEFNELQEPFAKKQKGSSAMPHKKNPIMCERVSGLARNIRGFALTALENQNLWHERDISHSSTERIIFPDATILLDYMLDILNNVLKDIVVKEDAMKSNIDKSFHVYYSQQLLLKLVDKGLLREKAYRMVQRNALDAFEQKIPFDKKVIEDPDISDLLTKDELSEIFNAKKYSKHLDDIYDRVYS